MLIAKWQCVEYMQDALQGPVRIDCGPDVLRIQQCFYRARKYCLAQGDHRFVILRFQVDGFSLVISKHPDPGLRWHRHKLRMLRELRAFIIECGTGVGQPISETTGTENSEGNEK